VSDHVSLGTDLQETADCCRDPNRMTAAAWRGMIDTIHARRRRAIRHP
jgi:hypothetical protein